MGTAPDQRMPNLVTYGAIEGRVQSLSQRKGLRFTLYYQEFDRAVSCYLSEGQEERMRVVGCATLRCMEIIEAEFENGVLRPMRRLALRPGERVGIVVVRRPDPARWNLARLTKIAAADEEKLAEEGLGDWADALDREDRR